MTDIGCKPLKQINSAVMVDFRLAFSEYGESFPDPGSTVPQFSTLTGTWPPSVSGESYEIYESTCDDLWCHKGDCIKDSYYSFQEDQVEKFEPELKLLLEEYEPGILQEKGGLDKFKEYMENHDLIRLLPGVVPGFALRSRKWGKLPGKQAFSIDFRAG